MLQLYRSRITPSMNFDFLNYQNTPTLIPEIYTNHSIISKAILMISGRQQWPFFFFLFFFQLSCYVVMKKYWCKSTTILSREQTADAIPHISTTVPMAQLAQLTFYMQSNSFWLVVFESKGIRMDQRRERPLISHKLLQAKVSSAFKFAHVDAPGYNFESL